MSYSTDLRTRVVAAVERGMPRAEIVATFQVSAGTIKRWLAKLRTTGTLAPHSPPGRTARIPPSAFPALRAQLAAHPDATLAQHVALWAEHQGVHVSRWTMSRAQRAVGWTRKKSR
jgi:transposase